MGDSIQSHDVMDLAGGLPAPSVQSLNTPGDLSALFADDDAVEISSFAKRDAKASVDIAIDELVVKNRDVGNGLVPIPIAEGRCGVR